MEASPPSAAFALEKMAVSTMPLAALHKGQQSMWQLVLTNEKWNDKLDLREQ